MGKVGDFCEEFCWKNVDGCGKDFFFRVWKMWKVVEKCVESEIFHRCGESECGKIYWDLVDSGQWTGKDDCFAIFENQNFEFRVLILQLQTFYIFERNSPNFFKTAYGLKRLRGGRSLFFL